jgi:hydrogenase large subunit
MAKRIVVDPVTRIEGHLRIEIELEGTRIVDAISSGTIFRGLEMILKNRDPRDVWAYTQRICGVCTHTHALASIRAVEDALKIQIPKNANIIRNIMSATLDVHDHSVHFYHLHGLDWINVVNCLNADPAETSRIAVSSSRWPLNSTAYFRDVQTRIKGLVDSGQLGIFAKGYWDHPAYRLSPELDLLGVAHYIEALNWQKEIVKIHAVFGGKNPHPNHVVGGVPCSINPDGIDVVNRERLALVKTKIDEAKTFVEEVLVPDVMTITKAYAVKGRPWGGGVRNYMAYGDYPAEDINKPDTFRVPRGIVLDRDLSVVHDIDLKDKDQIQEFISHSWFRYDDTDGGLHPYDGVTTMAYDGPPTPYTQQLDETKGYSWAKAPRWKGMPMEVGPLARLIVAYAKGNAEIREYTDKALSDLGLEFSDMYSTLGRTLARALEARQRVNLLGDLYDELTDNLKTGDIRTFNNSSWNPDTWPTAATGTGFTEAPRGALGHWISIRNQKIANYQCVVPSTWNASPQDDKGQKGPYELAVMETPMEVAGEPLELLRTIHSFDPCIACATHLLDPDGNELMRFKIM